MYPSMCVCYTMHQYEVNDRSSGGGGGGDGDTNHSKKKKYKSKSFRKRNSRCFTDSSSPREIRIK